MKIISWNVNGIKSLVKGGFFNEIFKEDADMICLQELRTHDEIPTVEGYTCYRYFSAKKRKWCGSIYKRRGHKC